MLLPKRVKYRRVQRGRMTGKAMRGNTVTYGEFGLVATEPAWITSNQIEAARIAMTRYTKRSGQVWIKIFPDKPVSKKALGVRMGSGKGAPEYWVAVVKAQKVMFEIGGVSEEDAREALRLAQHKLPIKTKIIAREDAVSENGGE
jgi:large subunit ribosomal protein L16